MQIQNIEIYTNRYTEQGRRETEMYILIKTQKKKEEDNYECISLCIKENFN